MTYLKLIAQPISKSEQSLYLISSLLRVCTLECSGDQELAFKKVFQNIDISQYYYTDQKGNKLELLNKALLLNSPVNCYIPNSLFNEIMSEAKKNIPKLDLYNAGKQFMRDNTNIYISKHFFLKLFSPSLFFKFVPMEINRFAPASTGSVRIASNKKHALLFINHAPTISQYQNKISSPEYTLSFAGNICSYLARMGATNIKTYLVKSTNTGYKPYQAIYALRWEYNIPFIDRLKKTIGLLHISAKKHYEIISELEYQSDMALLREQKLRNEAETQKTIAYEKEKKNQELIKELEEKNNLLKELVVTDPLTQVLNRLGGESFVYNIWPVLKRKATDELCVLMIDIDLFKKFNDTYGHQTGDLTLYTVAQTIKNCIREGDRIFRYGGEEFCVILTNTQFSQALIAAEKIRAKVEETSIPVSNGKNINCTISIGLTLVTPANITLETKEAFEMAIKFADNALYLAKSNGRNRVEAEIHRPM